MENSTYVWFPQARQTPESTKVFSSRLGTTGLYSFNRPGSAPVVVCVKEYTVTTYYSKYWAANSSSIHMAKNLRMLSQVKADSQLDQREVLRLLRSSPE
ncbi:hypothetical protein BGW80DRAFT_1308232 [Lactifluus volemus]|nr:hypothetical protein BGW80DRAFT_1308232 [Lactifluus volemus]